MKFSLAFIFNIVQFSLLDLIEWNLYINDNKLIIPFTITKFEIKSTFGLDKFANLTEIQIIYKNLKDIKELSSFKSLVLLDLSFNYYLRSIKPIENLVKLKNLDLSGNNINFEKSNLNNLVNLEILYLKRIK